MIVLFHHGIKGQRWGVRRGPPYPIEDKIMRKGSRLNSVSSYANSEEYRNRGRWMYTYNPNDKHDDKIYKGPFSLFLREEGAKYVYEHQYETIKDLKMPTHKERVEEFVKLYNSYKISTTIDLARTQIVMKLQGVGSEKARKLNLLKADANENTDQLYEIFNHAMERAGDFCSTRKYVKIMESKYDGMVDDNNQGVYNGAHDPVIIFRAKEALRTLGDARILDASEIISNTEELRNHLAKKGERIKI